MVLGGYASRSVAFLTSLFLLVDGFFHLTSSQEAFERVAPDWQIARNLFNTGGFPVFVHRIVGIYLIFASLYSLYMVMFRDEAQRKGDLFYQIHQNVVTPIALVVIAYGLGLMWWRGRSGGAGAAKPQTAPPPPPPKQ